MKPEVALGILLVILVQFLFYSGLWYVCNHVASPMFHFAPVSYWPFVLLAWAVHCSFRALFK